MTDPPSRQRREALDARQAVEQHLAAERDGQAQRADRMREEAQHWAGRLVAAVDEREAAEARAHRAEAALERVRAGMLAYVAVQTNEHGARYFNAGWREVTAMIPSALSAPADASGEADSG